MPDPNHEQLRRLFDLVMSAAPAERAAVLRSACPDDAELRRRVTAMIAAAEDPRFLAAPTADAGALDAAAPKDVADVGAAAAADSTTATPREAAGTRIGAYKILQVIGEGGFGTVYLAEQVEPVRRRVALKIIKPGMDSKQVIGRFEAERQALALMDHPHIARVLDGGLTAAQRPYFVMEYVVGDAVTAFADAHRLPLAARLNLFTQVCQAVQHAHTKGVIHRDLKPANVLVSMVDGKPFAKVIDFGIAKATGAAGGRLTDKTFFTEHRQLIGTPEYMSPEQAEGSPDIDTRTDVYALGVLLYELLTGTTPFDAKRLRSAALAELQRIIREEEPAAPSIKLSRTLAASAAAAAARQVEPARLRALIQGELDWIALKALDKDRARRYETPAQLAADVARHVAGEPVLAAPPSAAYRFRKFVRRHKGTAAATAAIATVLLAATAVSTGFAIHAARSEAKTREETAKALAAMKSEAEAREQIADRDALMLCGTFDAEYRSIDLHATPTPGAVRQMARMRIEHVTWVNDEVSPDETCRILAGTETGLTALTELDFSFRKLTDAGLKELARADTGLKALTTLRLMRTEVTDAGLMALARADTGLKSLTWLDLEMTNLTDAGLKELARADSGLKALTMLNLCATSVTDAGLMELARTRTGLETLTTLDLTGTNITDAALKNLARSDTGLKALTSLEIGNSNVTDAGVAALARPDTGLRALTALNLWQTRVTDSLLIELARADSGLKGLTTLNLSFNSGLTDVGLKALTREDSGFKSLTKLDISGTKVTTAGIEAVRARFPGISITALASPNSEVTEARERTADAEAFSRCGTFNAEDRSVNLIATPTPGALRYMARMRVATIGSEEGIDLNDETCRLLAATDFGSVITLDLAGRDPFGEELSSDVTDAGVQALARPDTGLKAITTLDLSNTQVADTGVMALSQPNTGLKAITTLILRGTKVTDAGLQALARADTGLKNLTELDLLRTYVTDAGVQALARSDGGLKNLSTLDLGATGITDAGLRALARPDTGLKALTSLSLSENQRVTDEGIEALARPDSGLTALATLDLSNTRITDAGVRALAQADSGLKALTKLSLLKPYPSNTSVTDAGIAALRARFPGIKIERHLGVWE